MPGLSKIDAVILCGGLGTRLRSKIGDSQKTMAEVNEEPFLNIILKYLVAEGFKKAILCTGFHAERVEEYYQSQDFGLEIVFSGEDKPLGTGGAIKNAKRKIRSDPFIVMNGDSFCALDYHKFLHFHQFNRAVGTIAVCPFSQTQEEGREQKDYGSILMNDKKKIINFQEKTGNAASTENFYVNAGVYCFNKDIFTLMPRKKAFSIEQDFFAKIAYKKRRRRFSEEQKKSMVAVGELQAFYGFAVEETFIDIGTPERYAEAQRFFRKAV